MRDSPQAPGSAVNASLAGHYRHLQQQETIDAEALVEAFYECWDEKKLREAIQHRDGETREDSIERVLHLLEIYL